MRRRSHPALLAMFLVLMPATSALAQYDYGGGASYMAEEGFVLEIEAGVGNPRNTDNIVAASGPNVVIPSWDDEFAGRLGFGYQFTNGGKLMVGLWSFDAEQQQAGVGALEFPIGPTSGFNFDVTTEVQAQLADVSWNQAQPVSDTFHMEWGLGLRFASFEETTTGMYGTAGGPRVPYKSNMGDMLGVRFAGRATRRFGSFSVGGGLALSLLDGEHEASSKLTPQPVGTAALFLTDDSRSGSIVEIDARVGWHTADESLAIWIGWEEQIWDQIAADLARNLPGSAVIARDRDSVTFSWLKLGTSFKF